MKICQNTSTVNGVKPQDLTVCLNPFSTVFCVPVRVVWLYSMSFQRSSWRRVKFPTFLLVGMLQKIVTFIWIYVARNTYYVTLPSPQKRICCYCQYRLSWVNSGRHLMSFLCQNKSIYICKSGKQTSSLSLFLEGSAAGGRRVTVVWTGRAIHPSIHPSVPVCWKGQAVEGVKG